MSNIIEIENLNKYYGYGRNRLHVLSNVNLTVKKGEILSIVGPSGAGKSTLLNCIGCLDSFQSGRLKISNQDLSGLNIEELSGFRNKTMGFIFQLHNLLPEFTAIENIMMPLYIRRMLPGKARKKALDVIDRFGLLDRADHKPSEMSGGECQRIAVARAIVGGPHLVLADEPTGSLDSSNSANLVNILFELARENETTIILVTHDLKIAQKSDRVIQIVDGTVVEGDQDS